MASNKTRKQLRAKIRWGIVGIFVLFLITLGYDMPVYLNRGISKINNAVALGIPTVPEKGFSLGLDLQGGAHLIYEADTTAIVSDERSSAVEGVRDVIERRVNGIGVGEPNVQTSKVGEIYRVIVELPGVTDVKNAISMIGETPILEFKEQNNIPPRNLTAEEQAQIDEYNVDAQKRANEILTDVKNGTDFEQAAKEKSEDEQSKNNGGYLGYLSEHIIYSEIYDWASTASEGEISKTLVETEDGFNILKRGSEKDGDLEVSASHILICYLGAKNCSSEMNKDEAFLKAQSLYNQANSSNFETLVRENSDDPTTKENGGDLGSFPRGSTSLPAFEDAVFGAEVGSIIGPIESEFGYHVIYKKSEKTAKQYEIWRIFIANQTAKDILPSQDKWMNTSLSGGQLGRAEVTTDSRTGAIQVALQFDSEGKDLFKDITERNVGKPVAIFLDGTPISIPVVQQAIGDGRAVITGNFDLAEARLLSQRLNAGALPVPIELVSQQSVGATLGAVSLKQSLYAGVVGLILVMIFMILYYRLPGLISVLTLSLYAVLTLAIFKWVGVTLTLAGIAGLILSVGMAVDANVLIFERLKEELREGKSLRTAVEEGFLRAWSSIKDGNVSTLITCALLLFFGSSFVKGFAITLALGVLVSLFTAVTVTRIILRFIVPWFKDNKAAWLFLGTKNK